MHRAELIAKARGKLELHLLGRCSHALHQAALKFVGLAFKKELSILDRRAIVRLGDQSLDARSGAAFNVVLQAGARVIALKVDLAAGNQEALAHNIGEPMGKVAGEIRAKISGTILA